MSIALIEVNNEPLLIQNLCDNKLSLPYKVVSNFYNEEKEKQFIELKFLTRVSEEFINSIQALNHLQNVLKLLKQLG